MFTDFRKKFSVYLSGLPRLGNNREHAFLRAFQTADRNKFQRIAN